MTGRCLQGPAVEDAVDRSLLERGTSKPRRGVVEAVLVRVHLRSHQRGVLELLQALGDEADELAPQPPRPDAVAGGLSHG